MKKITLLFVLLFVGSFIGAKNKTQLEKIQGVWSHMANGYTSNNQVQYLIVKGNRSISIGYISEDTSMSFSLSETIKGFLDYNPQKEHSDDFNIDSLKADGALYCGFFKESIKPNGNVSPHHGFIANLSFDEDMMVVYGSNETRWSKISRLPSFAIRLLYNRGKKDNRDYLNEYLDASAVEITVDKTTIYKEPNVPSSMYLIKGDVPTVLEESKDWLKVEYLGKKLVTGWIKKIDTDLK